MKEESGNYEEEREGRVFKREIKGKRERSQRERKGRDNEGEREGGEREGEGKRECGEGVWERKCGKRRVPEEVSEG